MSGFLAEWTQVHERDITVVVDLEGDIDHGAPTTSDRMLCVYLPFHDATLPNCQSARITGQ